jgi:hypothetical protein
MGVGNGCEGVKYSLIGYFLKKRNNRGGSRLCPTNLRAIDQVVCVQQESFFFFNLSAVMDCVMASWTSRDKKLED